MANELQEYLWTALEGALGRQKCATLRQTGLDDLVRYKLAYHDGVELDSFTLPDAFAMHAMQWRKKKAQQRVSREGIQALKALYPGSEKTASSRRKNPLQVRNTFWGWVGGVKKAHILEAVANQDQTEKIAHYRFELEDKIFGEFHTRAKALNDGDYTRTKHASSAKELAALAGKGLVGGAGAAIPLYIAGDYLADRKMEDAKQQALQGAMALGGIGLTGYGLWKRRQGQNNVSSQSTPSNNARRSSSSTSPYYKVSSVQDPLQSLADVIHVDLDLENESNLQKKASLRREAREYGAWLLTMEL